MPHVTVNSNVPEAGAPDGFITDVWQTAADALDKDASYIVAHLQLGQNLIFGGTHEPACSITIDTIGPTSHDKFSALAKNLTEIAQSALGIDPGRCWVRVTNFERDSWAMEGIPFSER